MIELNEKALEQDRARLIHILVVHFDVFRDKAEEAADLFLHDKTLPAPEEVVFCPQCGWNSAMDGNVLPAPDDGVVERLRYRVENPSAWDTFDQGGSDLIAEAATALQYKDERIERLSVQLEASALVAVELSSRLDAAEQQVQKLTDEIDRIEGHAREAVKLIAEGYPQHACFSLIAILEGQEGGE